MITFVDLMTAIATDPSSSPRSRTASLDMSDTTRNGPALELDLGHHRVGPDVRHQTDEAVPRGARQSSRQRRRRRVLARDLRDLVAVDDLAAGLVDRGGQRAVVDPAAHGVVTDTQVRRRITDPHLRHGPNPTRADAVRVIYFRRSCASTARGRGPLPTSTVAAAMIASSQNNSAGWCASNHGVASAKSAAAALAAAIVPPWNVAR